MAPRWIIETTETHSVTYEVEAATADEAWEAIQTRPIMNDYDLIDSEWERIGSTKEESSIERSETDDCGTGFHVFEGPTTPGRLTGEPSRPCKYCSAREFYVEDDPEEET